MQASCALDIVLLPMLKGHVPGLQLVGCHHLEACSFLKRKQMVNKAWERGVGE